MRPVSATMRSCNSRRFDPIPWRFALSRVQPNNFKLAGAAVREIDGMRLTVCPILNLWVRVVIANTPLAAYGSTFIAGSRRHLTRPGLDSVALPQAPKLKTSLLNGRFNHVAGKAVGRASVGCDGADRTPGSQLLRQLAAGQIASKRAEVRICLRLEYEYPHDLTSMSCDVVAVVGFLVEHH